MVAFPEKTGKERKAPIGNKTREEIVKEVEERIKTMVKELLEALMREERDIYLKDHPAKANGYYTCDLLISNGSSPLQNLVTY